MSKTGWIVLIVCLCLVFCICAGIFLAGRVASRIFTDWGSSRVDTSTTKDYKDLKNEFSEKGIYYVEKMEDLKELTVDWISGSVTIELSDGDKVCIQETADASIREKDALRYGVSGNKLRIQACKKNYVGKLPRKDLLIVLPRSLAAGLKELEIDTVSASVSAYELHLDELEIDSVSGKVDFQDVVAEEARFDTVSGDVTLRDCSVDSLHMNSVSARLSVTGDAKKVKTSSVSGAVELTLDSCKEVRVNTMSGSVTLDFAQAPKSLQVDTTSGKTDLTLPKDASCTIDLDAMSGKLYLNDEAVSSKKITLGDGDASYDIDAMSGSVYVHTK